MERDITYIPEITETECFGCNKNFKLYLIQKTGIVFCKVCGPNLILSELTTISQILKKIVSFAEKENQKIDDKLVVDISKLIDFLQE